MGSLATDPLREPTPWLRDPPGTEPVWSGAPFLGRRRARSAGEAAPWPRGPTFSARAILRAIPEEGGMGDASVDGSARDRGKAAGGGEREASGVRPGRISVLLAELAHVPESDLESAWVNLPGPGDALGRFELRREIGRGGFGVVYEARDRDLGRLVALKIVRPAPRSSTDRADLLLREAEAAAHLNHPNVVTLYDVGRWEGGPYLVFELLRGESLEERLRRGPLTAAGALRIARAVAEGLAHAHGAGVVHRDLKPANVFLAEDGAVKLVDLGLARVFGAGGPDGSGTPAYMAPEQWHGEPEGPRTDVFAAGVLLHTMLAGDLPFGEKGAGAAGAPAAPLPRTVPGALRRVVERALALEPAARPRDGRALLDEVLAAERALGSSRGRRAIFGAAWALLAIAVAAVGWAVLRGPSGPPPPPPPRIRVIVADVTNESGERNLDALSGLLVTSLEQSPRLAIVPRSRLFDLLRQSGREEVGRIDADVARSLAERAGARLLLAPTASRRDGAYAVELAALDLSSDERLFAVREEAHGQDAVPGLVDRIARQVREKMRERSDELSASRIEVGRSVTASLDAYRHYYEGQECVARPSRGPSWHRLDCAGFFRKAVEIDPGFALAHYQLAKLLVSEGSTVDRQREALEPALANVERAPPRERDLVLAWKAHLDGDDARALALYKRGIDASPEDKQTVYLAADLLHHRGDLAEAIPYLERVLELDPEFEFAMEHAVEDLGWLGRRDRLRELVRGWEKLPPDPARLHALSTAKGWIGDARGALDVARGAYGNDGGAALGDLVRALLYAGDGPGAEALLRREIARGRSDPERLGYLLAVSLANQGRWREASAVLDGLLPRLASDEGRIVLHARRAHLLAGFGDAASVLRELDLLRPLDPSTASHYAVHVAYAGDVESAARLASALDPAEEAARLASAVIALRRGRAAEAADALAPLAAPGAVRPWFPEDAPVFLQGEALAEAGRCAQAVDALRRYQEAYVPTHFWRPWALARSRLLLARCYERLGRPDAARQEVDRLLRSWARGDREQIILREARALHTRLARSGSP